MISKRMIKKSAFGFAMVAIFGMMTGHLGHHMHGIAKQYKKHGDENSFKGTAERFPEDIDEEKFM